ncbi:sulfatase [Luteolibacter marinus]|uniref:sulfatase n=1 Tax=Luteolibacter marinus TaxID=2776705 RepID=UPI0018678E9A|nr:sulfatase [Luteolibacter marinus]
MIRSILAAIALLAPCLAADKPNVLLILVDDLKPTLGCYGDAAAKTPAIDQLAERGMRFDLAYCNQSVCAPSRINLMAGSRSTSTGIYNFGADVRKVYPDAVTLPQWFSKHGYQSQALGKVFHFGHGNIGDPASWDVPVFKDKLIEYLEPESTGGKLTREEAYFSNRELNRIHELPRGAAWESPDVADDAYADGRVANEAIRRLKAAKENPGKPFFMALGFARPHLPFSVPKKYWDLYDPAKLPQPEFTKAPAGAPAQAGKHGGEIVNFKPIPQNGNIGEKMRRKLIHGYYAGASYTDAQIGKVIAELDRQGLADNTIIVLWGDHGWHLGDHDIWTKHTNYEQANRIPLLIIAPGVTQAHQSTKQLAETVDLYPTLAELAGLPAPVAPQPLDGTSLVPVLKDPAARVRDHAYHCYPRQGIGRAIRTERYRLIEWKKSGAPPETAELELYDYQEDPLETKNLAEDKPEVVAELRAILARHPEAAKRR